jgi:hypothetical protein
MHKGFARPLILIVLLALLTLSASYVLQNKSTLFGSGDVKGTSSPSEQKPGFKVTIISTGGTWELYQYLCATKEECSQDLEAGKMIGRLGGGSTESYEHSVKATPEWKEYKYIKYFAKPGWNSADRSFRIIDTGAVDGSIKQSFKDGEAVIVPVDTLLNSFQVSATISDKN